MGPAQLGYLVAAVLISLVVPLILLLALKRAIPAKLWLIYAITGAIAVVTPWLAVKGGGDSSLALLASLILAALFFWRYKRDAAKAATKAATKASGSSS